MKKVLRDAIWEAAHKLYPELPPDMPFTLDFTNKEEHGDFASNIAMQLAKTFKRNPKALASEIAENISCPLVERIEVAGAGFINFFLMSETFGKWLSTLLTSLDTIKPNIGEGKKALVEFVSANPTGPLHIGHGRGAVVGDSIANILEAVGYAVRREYYVNDGGNQMANLAKSIYHHYAAAYGVSYPFPEDGYQGGYIKTIAEKVAAVHGDKLLQNEEKAIAICKEKGITDILREIDETLKLFKVRIDEYFYESSLYKNGNIERVLEKLKNTGAIFEQDGALWLSVEKMGDSENRVLVKSDGSCTYLTPDIAYHENKFERGFDLLVDVWGSDHHGYIKRMQCALELLGHDSAKFDVVLVQMVNLIKSIVREDGSKAYERIPMSTRAGKFIPLTSLIDEVSVDAARFFYNMRSADSQFDFDTDLAKERSSDNPVYYVQYAHARVASLHASAREKGLNFDREGAKAYLKLLELPSERAIIKKLMAFSGILEGCALYNEPHRLLYYLMELASLFHAYYYNTVILDSSLKELSTARLALSSGVADIIKYGLELVGVQAPEKM